MNLKNNVILYLKDKDSHQLIDSKKFGDHHKYHIDMNEFYFNSNLSKIMQS